MFSILICLVMESHIGSLIKVLEVTFLPHVFMLHYGQAIKGTVRGGRRSQITTSRPAAGLVTTEPADWLTISDSSNLILRAGRAHIVSYLPPANTRETGTLNNTQSSVISFKSVLQSISFNISINLLLLLARWEERLTDTNSPTDVGIFIRTNNVALWIFFKKSFSKIFHK